MLEIVDLQYPILPPSEKICVLITVQVLLVEQQTNISIASNIGIRESHLITEIGAFIM